MLLLNSPLERWRPTLFRSLVLASLPLGVVACAPSRSGSAMAPETESYSRAHLPGSGLISHVLVVDRALTFSSEDAVERFDPIVRTDARAFDYLKIGVGPEVKIERIAAMRSLERGFKAGAQPALAPLPRGTIYVEILNLDAIRRGEQRLTKRLEVAVYGGAEDIGSTLVKLSGPAPADVPCKEYCDDTEEAFRSIKGRLDAVILRLKRDR